MMMIVMTFFIVARHYMSVWLIFVVNKNHKVCSACVYISHTVINQILRMIHKKSDSWNFVNPIIHRVA